MLFTATQMTNSSQKKFSGNNQNSLKHLILENIAVFIFNAREKICIIESIIKFFIKLHSKTIFMKIGLRFKLLHATVHCAIYMIELHTLW